MLTSISNELKNYQPIVPLQTWKENWRQRTVELKRVPGPPEIYKQVKIICNQENDPVRRETILERLFKSSLSDKRKWLDYRDLLWSINYFNYENLSFFDPLAERKLFGNGHYPIEKISLSKSGYTHLHGVTEPQWVQIWDFDFYEKNDQIIEKKVFLHIKLVSEE